MRQLKFFEEKGMPAEFWSASAHCPETWVKEWFTDVTVRLRAAGFTVNYSVDLRQAEISWRNDA